MKNKNATGRIASVVLMATLILLCACEKQATQVGAASSSELSRVAMAGAAAAARARAEADTLAYEHTVSIEIDKALLPARLREIEAACRAVPSAGCTILDVSLNSHEDLPNGSIRMRLASDGIESIVALASKEGTVVGRTSHAEDLAEPIADTERQLALMNVHRDRLAEFMKSKDLKVEQLIAVSKELADVQSQIDALGTQRATLRRRVDTDLLTIQLSLPPQVYAANQSPVTDALRAFGHDVRTAVGMMIRFLAVLIPWLVIILPGLFLLRLFWRWMGRKIARRESTT